MRSKLTSIAMFFIGLMIGILIADRKDTGTVTTDLAEEALDMAEDEVCGVSNTRGYR